METTRLVDPAFWSSSDAVAPGSSLPEGVADPHGLVWFQTSGSTGGRKWIGHTREGLLLSASVVNRHLGVSESDVWGLALPIHHVGGFGVLARAFEAGCRWVDHSGKWEPKRFVNRLAVEEVTHVSLVPTQVHDLVETKLSAPKLLRAVVVGGGVLDEALGRAARTLGWPVLASYGMTEAASQVATQSLNQLGSPYVAGPLEVLPHWQVQTADDGRLMIQGDSLFTASITKQGGEWIFRNRTEPWFVTSDLAAVEARQISVRGRADRIVKVLGELIDLNELEGSLDLPDAIVVALPDARRGSRLILVSPNEGQKAMQAHNKRVEGPWRLMGQVFVGEIPRGELGKIRYSKLSEVVQAMLNV